jgi:hypothetical protein
MNVSNEDTSRLILQQGTAASAPDGKGGCLSTGKRKWRVALSGAEHETSYHVAVTKIPQLDKQALKGKSLYQKCATVLNWCGAQLERLTKKTITLRVPDPGNPSQEIDVYMHVSSLKKRFGVGETDIQQTINNIKASASQTPSTDKKAAENLEHRKATSTVTDLMRQGLNSKREKTEDNLNFFFRYHLMEEHANGETQVRFLATLESVKLSAEELRSAAESALALPIEHGEAGKRYALGKRMGQQGRLQFLVIQRTKDAPKELYLITKVSQRTADFAPTSSRVVRPPREIEVVNLLNPEQKRKFEGQSSEGIAIRGDGGLLLGYLV